MVTVNLLELPDPRVATHDVVDKLTNALDMSCRFSGGPSKILRGANLLCPGLLGTSIGSVEAEGHTKHRCRHYQTVDAAMLKVVWDHSSIGL